MTTKMLRTILVGLLAVLAHGFVPQRAQLSRTWGCVSSYNGGEPQNTHTLIRLVVPQTLELLRQGGTAGSGSQQWPKQCKQSKQQQQSQQ